jgi:hypothetical protein
MEAYTIEDADRLIAYYEPLLLQAGLGKGLDPLMPLLRKIDVGGGRYEIKVIEPGATSGIVKTHSLEYIAESLGLPAPEKIFRELH